MRYLKTIFNILSWPVYLCIAAYLLIASPLLIGFHPVVVLSGSMEPTYHVGSILYYKAAEFEEIAEGDPITFYAGEDGAMVTHRVVEKREAAREFVTQGDANNSADPNPVAYERVAGKAGHISLPLAGYFVTFGKKPVAIAIMGAILLLGLLFDNLGEEKKKPAQGNPMG